VIKYRSVVSFSNFGTPHLALSFLRCYFSAVVVFSRLGSIEAAIQFVFQTAAGTELATVFIEALHVLRWLNV